MHGGGEEVVSCVRGDWGHQSSGRFINCSLGEGTSIGSREGAAYWGENARSGRGGYFFELKVGKERVLVNLAHEVRFIFGQRICRDIFDLRQKGSI